MPGLDPCNGSLSGFGLDHWLVVVRLWEDFEVIERLFVTAEGECRQHFYTTLSISYCLDVASVHQHDTVELY